MALRELASLEKYLGLKKPNKYSTQGDKKVPVLQNNNAPPLVGLVTIACHLVKEAKRPELLGDGAEGRAVVQQWLEYRVTKLDSHIEDTKSILKDLNLYMQDKVYLAGNQLTLADVLMYYGIHSIIDERKASSETGAAERDSGREGSHVERCQRLWRRWKLGPRHQADERHFDSLWTWLSRRRSST
ncbi:eukaryotic translation elongation factor 1 epsilon-1 isoform X1 [Xiphophorus hellerii]|uniref:eukaryotic translation elongation factor 1 epsilon-1 isoform X1 n=1 Tax=Xiphophorus hellerii TaxID=8084 RepID=UPI0013B3EE81|nr:eukaryotic translation elongation factor 1 epsilon-1 isoform X1 [Xiphophorus hellerii]